LKKHEYRETGIPVWTMDNIQKNDFIERGCLYISEEKFIELKSYTVDENVSLLNFM